MHSAASFMLSEYKGWSVSGYFEVSARLQAAQRCSRLNRIKYSLKGRAKVPLHAWASR